MESARMGFSHELVMYPTSAKIKFKGEYIKSQYVYNKFVLIAALVPISVSS